jgi:hypothetical protein
MFMIINVLALRDAGVAVLLDGEELTHISNGSGVELQFVGGANLSGQAADKLWEIGKEYELSDNECENLIDHFCKLTIFTVIKKVAK